jgi:hypothetical protein
MKIIKYIISFLKVIDNHGVLGLLTYFIPVYWEQDSKFVNNGQDLFFFRRKNSEHCYFRGTYSQRNKAWQGK